LHGKSVVATRANPFVKTNTKVPLGIGIALLSSSPEPPDCLAWIASNTGTIAITQGQVVLGRNMPTSRGLKIESHSARDIA
jgi:hypothetical protein